MLRAMQRSVFLVLSLSACSGDDGGGLGLPGDGLPAGWQDAEPLSCESYSLDATASTVRYDGQELPELAGGEFAEGLYRRMYTLSNQPVSAIAGDHDDQEEADALLFANGRVLSLRFGGAVGTYETREATLHLSYEESCDSETGEATESPATKQSFTYGVDAKGNLSLAGTYTLNGEPFNYVAVYRKTSDLCERGNEERYPATPGTDSWHCLPEVVSGGFISCSCKVDGEYAFTSE
jgi:hypothetical protein